MTSALLWLLYGTPLLGILILHLRARAKREAHGKARFEQAIKSGLTEPASLHPVVDPAICMGSGACLSACPEEALGIVNGKATLVNPTVCIGHGACAAACPAEAIKLVFGTAKRGIDIPLVKPNFESNVPGIYIAGEIGGMGLVRKAAEQGKQAIENIAKSLKSSNDADHDVIIIGAGPAGLSATLGAMEKQLRFVTLEQENSLGGTVYHYPRNKIVMTQPVVLPLIGKAKLGEISKEALLAFWQEIVDRVKMPISFGERVENVRTDQNGLHIVKTQRREYRTRTVILAIGRRGTPRTLDVPGEDSPKVVYRLVDPEQYRAQKVLVVGGGDSAVEAAIAISEEEGSSVTLSYRGDAFGRVKEKNRARLADAEQRGRIRVALASNVLAITEKSISLEVAGVSETLENDAVIVCAGGILPTGMLKDMGIQVDTKYGTE